MTSWSGPQVPRSAAMESLYDGKTESAPSCVANILPGVVRGLVQSTPSRPPSSHTLPSEIGFSLSGKLLV